MWILSKSNIRSLSNVSFIFRNVLIDYMVCSKLDRNKIGVIEMKIKVIVEILERSDKFYNYSSGSENGEIWIFSRKRKYMRICYI